MIRYSKEFKTQEVAGPRGGLGTALMQQLLTQEDTGKRFDLFNHITLLPGASIGEHPHIDDGEVYLVTEGELVFIENGQEYVLHAGDITYTANGDTHAMINRSDKPGSLLAIVVS